jgi:glycosyltransferase involved in cell wall biosynthesis
LRRLGVPCLATNHGVFGVLDGYIGAQRSLLTKLLLLPAAWLGKMQVLAHVTAEIAVSQNDYRALRRRYWPLRSRFRQIYHSRIHESEPVETRVRKPVIHCAGTMGPRKGQPFLAHAFAEIASEFPDWKLIFIGRYGDPVTAAEVQSVMAGLPDQILWIQNCSDSELKQHLQSAEIFAMPSLHEGLGLSLQEALYYGCACVASGAEGILDLINHDENGILVPPADPHALAQALARLMRDAELRERLRRSGRDSVLQKGMTAERMVKNYLHLYDEVLHESEVTPP